MVKRRILALLILLLLLAGCTLEPVEEPQRPPQEPQREASCSITMLDVGQGLCIRIQADGETLLYDGGDREHSSFVVKAMEEVPIKYLVASHYDEDHISGLVGVLHRNQVETALMPDYEADTKIYDSLQTGLWESGAKICNPVPGDRFPLGRGTIEVLGPEDYRAEENNCSLVLMFQYGGVRVLLTGDAEAKEEAALIASGRELSADILVAGHHGSASSSTEAFLQAVQPKEVFLSCGAGNSYGHPTKSALEHFRQVGAQLFRTDSQGTVTAYTDGESLWFSTEPTEDWRTGDNVSVPEPTRETATSFVLNVDSHRFHLPSCGQVERMAPENRRDTILPREALLLMGYTPCGSCDP